jgi:hypothetical protein
MSLEAASNSTSGAGQQQDAATTLLRTPRIFMLVLVWESPQVCVGTFVCVCVLMLTKVMAKPP